MWNPSQEVKDFLAWMDTIPEDQWPMCWQISGKDRKGKHFTISNQYLTKEDAEAAIPRINEWADPSTLQISHVWDMMKSEEEWWKTKIKSSDSESK